MNKELIQELKKLNKNLEAINNTLHKIDADIDFIGGQIQKGGQIMTDNFANDLKEINHNLKEKEHKETKRITKTNDIEQLRNDLIKSIDRVTSLFPMPRNRNEAIKGCLKLAQNLLARAKPKS